MFAAGRRKTEGASSEPAAVTRAVREAARFDRGSVSAGAGLLAAVPVVTVLAAGMAAGDPVPAVTMGAGAMLVGIAWRTGGGGPPLALLATDAAVMALSTFVGCVTGSVTWVHLVVLCLWSAIGGLLVGVGNRGGVVGTQAIIAVVVFGRFSQPAGAALGLAALVLAGGLAQVLFLSLVRWPSPLRAQRAMTAAAYRALSELAAAGPETSTLPAAAALDEAQGALAAPALFGDPALMTLRSLVGEGYRLRVELSAIHGLLGQRHDEDAPDAVAAAAGAAQPALALCSGALALAADAIQGDLAAAPALDQRIARLSAEADALSDLTPAPALPTAAATGPAALVQEATALHLAHRLSALAGQLRAVGSLAPAAGEAGGLRHRRPVRRANHPLQRLRTELEGLRANVSLDSPAGRHALRLSVVVPAAELISRQLPLQRGYWVVVAAATVLRPEFGATFTRGTERAVGTCLGVALAGAIAVVLHPAAGATVVIVGLMAWVGYATFPASFAVGFGFITALVVFLLNAINPDTLSNAGARLLDTLVGGSIGLLTYALWPTWSDATARQSLAELVDADRVYLGQVLAAILEGRPASEDEMRPLARRARMLRTNAEAAVARSLSEPPGRRIDADQSQGTLGAMRRLILATHVLRLDAQEQDRDRRSLAALAPLAGGVDTLLRAVETRLRSDARDPALAPAPLPDLRAAYGSLQRSCSQDPEGAALLAEIDEIVDAADGVATLVGLELSK